MEQVDEASFGDCAITRLHLNASGATVFTKLLIEDLKVWLEDTTPIAFYDREKPEFPFPTRRGIV